MFETRLGGVGEVDDHAAGEAAAHSAGRDHFHLLRVLGVPATKWMRAAAGMIADANVVIALTIAAPP